MKLTRNEKDDKIVEAMEIYGGSFVKALAVCLQKADLINYSKLRNHFRNYFNEYRKFVNKEK